MRLTFLINERRKATHYVNCSVFLLTRCFFYCSCKISSRLSRHIHCTSTNIWLHVCCNIRPSVHVQHSFSEHMIYHVKLHKMSLHTQHLYSDLNKNLTKVLYLPKPKSVVCQSCTWYSLHPPQPPPCNPLCINKCRNCIGMYFSQDRFGSIR